MGKRFTQFLVLAACLLLGTGMALAQVTTTGRLIGTVTDPTGAVVVGADVTVTDEATGKTFETKSGSDGGFTFSALQPGSYTVTVTMQGFKKAEVRAVKIVVSGQRGLTVQLELGDVATSVVIEAGAEVLQTSETKIGTTITGRSITQLPFTSRDALDLAVLMPGAQTVGRPRATSFLGLPKGAINLTLDGINDQDQVLKSSDGFFSMIRPRIDSIEEFSISTAAAGAGETGEGAVQIGFVTKRGTNEFHGGAWWYHRNDKFNSNYYFNNQAGTRKQRQRLNQFGVKVGGPIFKEKLFFFTALDFYRNPESRSQTRTILTTDAALGRFRYSTGSTLITPVAPASNWTTCGAAVTPGATGYECVVNLLAMAANPLNGAGVFPSTIDPSVGYWLTAMNSSVSVPGVGLLAPPSPFTRSITFNSGGAGRRNFPDFRFDYNINKNHSLTAIYHYNYFTATPDFLNGYSETYPVAPFNRNFGSQLSNRNSLIAAWRWNIGTTKTNEVRIGLVSAPISFFPDLNITLYPQISTNLGAIRVNPGLAHVDAPLLGYETQGRNGGLLQLIDTFSWTRGKHNLTLGGTWTELLYKDYYAGAAVGSVGLGITGNDPAVFMFTSGNLPGSATPDRDNASALYGSLIGRVTNFGAYTYLDPTVRNFVQGVPAVTRVGQTEIGIYATDNWRLFSTLTMNLGLRWEYQGAFRDKYNMYYRVDGDLAGLAGRSCSIGRLFQPGSATCAIPQFVLNGDQKWWNNDLNNLAPSLGLAWTPNFEGTVAKWLLGGPGKSVFRAGYSINFTREGVNNFFSIAGGNPGYSSYAYSSATTASGPGEFPAGSVMLSSGYIPNAVMDPPTFGGSFPLTALSGFGVNAYDPKLKVPYVQSWSVNWQREITPSTVVEVRYVGNHGTGLWRQFNLNEVNIFENGFLTEFNKAVSNLSVCRANSAGCIAAQAAAGVLLASQTVNSYANWGLSGQVALPIMTASFTGSTTPAPTNSNFRSGSRVGNLDNGLAGTFAGALNSYSFWSNLVAAGYSANFWMLNPDATGGSYLFGNQTHTTYNGLQIEVRRKPAKGLQFSGNYTFSKSLTNNFADSSYSYAGFSTLRQMGRDKGPSPWDLRHAFKLQLIYELPFGPGRKWSSSQGWLNRIIEGWEINTITRWQSGRVFSVTGGLGGTVNGNDGGVMLIGITPQEVQDALGVRKTTDGTNRVFWFPASLLDVNQQRANSAVLKACNTPGAFCQRLFLYGPSFFKADWSVAKRTKIGEKFNVEFRAEFLNAFNTINFYYGGNAAATVASASLQSTSFGRMTSAYQDVSTTDDPGGRIIQMVLRLNF
jgi:hypothetical protein